MKLYEVGGHVRDHLLGLKSKDVDYAVEMELREDDTLSAQDAYKIMNERLKEQGFEIFLETPDCFTTRAQFPKDHEHSGVADFVMCRKEVGYIKGTRQPIVELGTLYDDLERRDFTVNAIAKDLETGEIIDHFNGQKDLIDRVLKCPIDAKTSFDDDPLRILRALRFIITKGFVIDQELEDAIKSFEAHKMHVVSQERIREEFHKMFKHDTYNSFLWLMHLHKLNPNLWVRLFRGNMWLKPTLKDK